MKIPSITFLLAAIGSTLLPASTLAFSTSTGQDVSLVANQVRTGTYYAAGTTLDIQGRVDGDVICAGQTVTITGPVSGDIICAAETITIKGPVDGNVRLAASNVVLNGNVTKNATVLAQSLTQGRASTISGELMAQVQTLQLNGAIAKQAYGNATTATVNGTLAEAFRFQTDQLKLGPEAKLNGGLYYTSAATATIDPAAKITGENRRTSPAAPPTAVEAFQSRIQSWLASLLGALVTAAFLIWLTPRIATASGEMLRKRPGILMLAGLVLIVIAPIAALLAMVTIVGLPIGIIGLLMWGAALYLGRVVTAVAIGSLLRRRYGDEHAKPQPYRWAVMGVIVSWCVFLVPIIGQVASLAATLAGIGIMGKALRDFIDREDELTKTQPLVIEP